MGLPLETGRLLHKQAKYSLQPDGQKNLYTNPDVFRWDYQQKRDGYSTNGKGEYKNSCKMNELIY